MWGKKRRQRSNGSSDCSCHTTRSQLDSDTSMRLGMNQLVWEVKEIVGIGMWWVVSGEWSAISKCKSS